MSRKSGLRSLGSVKSKRVSHSRDLNRGEHNQGPQCDASLLRAQTSEDRGRKDPGNECVESDQLWRPSTASVRLYDQDEVTRTKIIWLTYGLLVCVVVGGLATLVAVTAIGANVEPVLDYLKTVTTAAFALATFAIGFYFGRHPRGGGAEH